MNADNIKFRCSSLGYLMTPPKSKSESISETTKGHLIDCFISANYNRREEIENKFLRKGNDREEDSITLLSSQTKIFFKKNDQKLENDFIKGEPDIFLGKDIYHADETFDTKTSWSAFTFFRSQKELSKIYYWQGMGYMALTGAKKHTVAFCLVNGTADAIMEEKRRAAYNYNLIDSSINPEYKDRCKQIEINHIYDLKAFQKENEWFDFDSDLTKWDYDIPAKERLFTYSFERNEAEIQALYNRVEECRTWININLFKIIPEREEIESQ